MSEKFTSGATTPWRKIRITLNSDKLLWPASILLASTVDWHRLESVLRQGGLMRIPTGRSAVAMAAFIGALAAVPAPASASLIGDTINASGVSLSPGSATIGAGVEFVGISTLQFDFDANSLTITDGNLVGWNGFGNFVFSGFDETITGLSILTNTGFSGSIISNFSFTSNSITLDMSSSTRTLDSVLRFGIQTVPEPATLTLLGLGLAGLGFSRRKR